MKAKANIKSDEFLYKSLKTKHKEGKLFRARAILGHYTWHNFQLAKDLKMFAQLDGQAWFTDIPLKSLSNSPGPTHPDLHAAQHTSPVARLLPRPMTLPTLLRPFFFFFFCFWVLSQGENFFKKMLTRLRAAAPVPRVSWISPTLASHFRYAGVI